ncbi:hypothetical protein CWO06_07265 [Vibrio splendidus]|nr:hypothetical protein CWO06_07265 [Vibrio splendidus]
MNLLSYKNVWVQISRLLSLILKARRFGSLNKLFRVIRNTWHFHYALVFVFKVVCRGFGIALFTLIGLHGLPLLSTIAPADNSGSDSSSTFGV